MKLFQHIAAAVVAISLATQDVFAHSVERNPLKYFTVLEDPVIHTPSHRVHSQSSFDLTFELHERQQFVKLSLKPNDDVIVPGATVSYIGADGEIHTTEELNPADHRVYKGTTFVKHRSNVEWTNVGWARIVVHEDGLHPIFEGAFRLDGDHHHIHPRETYLRTKHPLDPELKDVGAEVMVVWRDSDITEEFPYGHADLRRGLHEEACMADDLSFNTQPDHPVHSFLAKRSQESSWLSKDALFGKHLFGRQEDGSGTYGGNGAVVNLLNNIGSTAGCPTTRKVALVGVATDCTYTASFNSTATARQNVITQMNSASVLYENTFNISLGIQNLTISDANCPGSQQAGAPWNVDCNSGFNIQDRLNLFSRWRGERQDSNSHWTLLSTCNSGSAVGLAWLGQACINTAQISPLNNETSSGANVVVRTSTEWLVIAHETGHTFGAVHDCTTQTCNDGQSVNAQQCCPLSKDSCPADGRFVMNPSTSPGITSFSPCSIGNICAAIGGNAVKTQCLSGNKNVPTIGEAQCGNGIVEQGEECDCGGEAGCGDNSCCDAKTCKFKTGAVCDPSNEDCCTSQCKFAGAGTVCRASTGICDPEETCPGDSAVCPKDQTAEDGTSCGDSGQGLQCMSGQCTSRDLQCKSIMGVYTQGNSTRACDSSGCQISCASPEFGYNVCYKMQQYFLDGTPCSGDGHCQNGICTGATIGGEIRGWIERNKPLVIGLSAGIGGLLLLSILSCIISSCRRRRAKRRLAPGPPPGWPGPRPAYRAPPPPPPSYTPMPAPSREMMERNSGRSNGYAYGAGGQQYDDAWQGGPPPGQSPYGAPPAVRYA